ncbi:MAG: cupin domain-containing protein [Nostoc sp.]|uniref:cupin domain-containing protein n=1 Tax=Nostoc sp. TaxID=1180 RepID=UPI002FF75F87
MKNLPEESVSHNPEIKKKVMLRLGDLPHLTNFSQARFAPGQTAPAHAHQDMCEVFFVEAGSGVIYVEVIQLKKILESLNYSNSSYFLPRSCISC